jgi:hypothetical protein
LYGRARRRSTRPEATVVEGAVPGRAELYPAPGLMRGERLHTCARSALPEYRGVLGGGHGHFHDPGRYLYAFLRVLRREVGASRGAGQTGADASGKRGAPDADTARRSHIGEPG